MTRAAVPMGSRRTGTKLFYKIGEVCRLADIRPHVLRYWESEFPMLHPKKNRGGQRVYQPRDLELVLRIKRMLHDEGYTIAGAKRKLSGRGRAGEGEPDFTPEEGVALPGAVSAEHVAVDEPPADEAVAVSDGSPRTDQTQFQFGGGIREKKLEDALKKLREDIVDLLKSLD